MGLRKPVPFSEEHGIQEGVGKKSTQNVHLVQKVTGAAIIFPNPGPTDRGANSLYHGRPSHGTYPRPQTEAPLLSLNLCTFINLKPMEQNSSDSAHFQQVKKVSLRTNK